MARIALIVGSVREKRQGIKDARWMEEKLKSRDHTVYFIDPLELNLPLLNRMYKEMPNPSGQLIDLRNKIKDAEGYMPLTPEYNHTQCVICYEKYTRLLLGRVLFQTFCNCIVLPRFFSQALTQHNS
jgi:hypothetical protein